MKQEQLLFNNLHTLLSTPESRIQLSIFTGIPISKINNWLDPNGGVVPKANDLILMAKYFNCMVDYLLDLSDRREQKP